MTDHCNPNGCMKGDMLSERIGRLENQRKEDNQELKDRLDKGQERFSTIENDLRQVLDILTSVKGVAFTLKSFFWVASIVAAVVVAIKTWSP